MRRLLYPAILLVVAQPALAKCGPWDGTPYCVRNGATGLTSTRVNEYLDGYQVCYHGEGKVCRGGAWVGDLSMSCVNKPDTPSPAQAGDRPCSANDKQTNTDPIGNMGTPIGTDLGAPTPPADSPSPLNSVPPSFGPGRTPTRAPTTFQTGGSNAGEASAAACSQLQSQIQQVEANCVAMSATGTCSDPGKLSLIRQLQTALGQCR
jgi:hypothetical protein